MASVTRARKCSSVRLMHCQHSLAPTTRANHPTQTQCNNRRRLWVVVLAQTDLESDGPVLLIVCGLHKARLARGGGIVASEQVQTPAIPDSSDRVIEFAVGKRVVGWTVEEWIAFLDRNPDATLPAGVGGALVKHFRERSA